MGKLGLERWRASKMARTASYPGPKKRAPAGPMSPAALRHEMILHDQRTVTRVVAAMLHNVPLTRIARDQHLPLRTVQVVSLREKHL